METTWDWKALLQEAWAQGPVARLLITHPAPFLLPPRNPTPLLKGTAIWVNLWDAVYLIPLGPAPYESSNRISASKSHLIVQLSLTEEVGSPGVPSELFLTLQLFSVPQRLGELGELQFKHCTRKRNEEPPSPFCLVFAICQN